MASTPGSVPLVHEGVGLAVGVLSRPAGGDARCYQRATLHALVALVPPRGTRDAPQGWLPLQGGGALFLRYVVSLPSSLQEELARLASPPALRRPALGAKAGPAVGRGDAWMSRWMRELRLLGEEYEAHGVRAPAYCPQLAHLPPPMNKLYLRIAATLLLSIGVGATVSGPALDAAIHCCCCACGRTCS